MSFCAATFSIGAAIQMRLIACPEFVFFTTLFVYTGQRYFKIKRGQIHVETPRILWMKQHENGVVAILFLAFFGSLYYLDWVLKVDFLNLDLKTLLYFRVGILIFTGVISLFYVVRIGKRNLREIPLLKIFFVVIVYFLVCVILPYATLHQLQFWMELYPYENMVFLSVIFCYIFGVALLFDVSDVDVDAAEQRTIPQVIGLKKSILVSFGLMIPLLVFIGVYLELYAFIIAISSYVLFGFGYWKFRNKEFFIPFFGEAMLGGVGALFASIYLSLA